VDCYVSKRPTIIEISIIIVGLSFTNICFNVFINAIKKEKTLKHYIHIRFESK
jgi:hypothetical protein